MAELILAIDPGEQVGWATAIISRRLPDEPKRYALRVESHGITPLKDFAIKLHEAAGKYDTIVYEPYRVEMGKRGRSANANSTVPTLQLVGMIRLCAWLNPKVKLVSSGTNRKSTGRKVAAALFPEISAKIEEALASSHDSGHDGDALMHLVAYFHEVYV